MSSLNHESSRPNVIVIGAGIVGASLAWNLVRQGADVTIVTSDIGGTATRNSFAWLNATWRNTRAYYDFRRRSLEAWKRLAQEMPELHSLVQWCGSLQWDMPTEELVRFEKGHKEWGYDIRRIERDDMHRTEPCLRTDVLPEWGLRIGEEGAVEAAAAASIMVADARARGAQLLSAEVRSLIEKNGKIQGVILNTGEQKIADHVVLAAGVASKDLCSSVGIELPVTGSAALLVHSKPVSTPLLNGLVLAPGLHMRQTAEGRLVAGAGYAGSDPGENPEQTATDLFAKVKGLLSPEAIDGIKLEQDYFTIGIRPMPLDGLPILGPASVKGLTLAFMHSGVTLAAIVGELLAEDIVRGKSDAALQQFGLHRFRQSQE